MKNTMKLVGTVAVVCFGVSTVRAGDWEYSVGAWYRTFSDVDFARIQLVNTQDGHAGNGFVTGNNEFAPGVLTVVNGAKQGVNTNRATLHSVVSDSDSDELGSGLGVIVGATTPLGDGESGWCLDLSLGAVRSTSDASFGVLATPSTFAVQADDPSTPLVDENTWGAPFGDPNAVVVLGPAGDAGHPDVLALLDFDFDMELCTLGVGVSYLRRSDKASIRLGLGPALSLVDFDASRREDVSFDDGTPVYSAMYKDDGTSVRLGGYLGVALGVQLSERVGLALGCRYDYVADDLNTDFGEVQLSGASGTLKLVFSF